MSHFHPLDGVGRDSETQLRVGEFFYFQFIKFIALAVNMYLKHGSQIHNIKK